MLRYRSAGRHRYVGTATILLYLPLAMLMTEGVYQAVERPLLNLSRSFGNVKR